MTIRFDVKQSAAVQDIPGLFEIVPNNLGTLIASGDKKVAKVVGDGQPPLPKMFLYKRHLVKPTTARVKNALQKGVYILVDPRPSPDDKGKVVKDKKNPSKASKFCVYVGLGGVDGKAILATRLYHQGREPQHEDITYWDTAIVICGWENTINAPTNVKLPRHIKKVKESLDTAMQVEAYSLENTVCKSLEKKDSIERVGQVADIHIHEIATDVNKVKLDWFGTLAVDFLTQHIIP